MRAVAALWLSALLAGCEGKATPAFQRVLDGDIQAGRRAMHLYNCGSCHLIPGVPGARGTVGPPLTDFGLRVYIAGSLPNLPDNLVRWIREPPAIAPDTAMPDLGVTEEDARNIAAYLYTLR